jgi:hypothetical protein
MGRISRERPIGRVPVCDGARFKNLTAKAHKVDENREKWPILFPSCAFVFLRGSFFLLFSYRKI